MNQLGQKFVLVFRRKIISAITRNDEVHVMLNRFSQRQQFDS